MTTPALTARQQRFVEEYLVDLNATQAAIRAGYSAKNADQLGPRLVGKSRVAAAIQAAKAARADRTKITIDTVLERFWDIATADPRELVEYRRTCCRYCHGKDFDYHRTQGEMKRARASFDAAQSKKTVKEAKESVEVFDELGGVGYDPRKSPHADCPECWGEGVERAFIHDTRHLSPAAVRLYAGVRQMKDGVEVKMHDQQAALINVGRHLGMFGDNDEPQETEEERILRLRAGLKQMDETTIGRAA